jgi:hypothetical protein
MIDSDRPQMTIQNSAEKLWLKKVYRHTLLRFNTYCFSMATVLTQTCLSVMLYIHCLLCLSLLLFSVHYLRFSSSYFSVNTFSNDICSHHPSEKNIDWLYWMLDILYCHKYILRACVCVFVKVNLCLCIPLRHGTVAPFILINSGTRWRIVVSFMPLQLFFLETPPSILWTEVWVIPRTGLDISGKSGISCPSYESMHD